MGPWAKYRKDDGGMTLRSMNFEKFLAAVLVLGAVAFSIFFILVATDRELTGLEATFFQVVVLFLSLAGSFVGGRQFATTSAEQSLRRHAKSAFRRALSLYRGLSRIAMILTENAENRSDIQTVLAVIEAIVKEQIDTADDALEDWREIVPDDTEALERRISPRSHGGTNASG